MPLVYASAVPAPEADPMTAARRVAVGSRMRQLRIQAGRTQEAVAEAAGLTRQFYLAVEAGRRTLSLDNVFAIADALGTDPRDFFTGLPASGQERPSTESAKLTWTTGPAGVQVYLARRMSAPPPPPPLCGRDNRRAAPLREARTTSLRQLVVRPPRPAAPGALGFST